MRWAVIAICGAFAIFASAGPVRADPDATVIRLGKSASALVTVSGKGIGGSAFCIDGGGFFLTSAHAVRDAVNVPFTLVINSGEENEKQIRANVIRLDKDLNLALLKADVFAPMPALEPGDDSALIETMQVIVFGYPIDDALSATDGKFPSVNVNLARINALRKARGQLEFLQLDAQLNAGNCGGAVLDSKGNIIGVVSSPIRGSGTNLVIPINQVLAFMSRPHISFTPPQIAYAQRYESTELSFRLVCFGRTKPKLAVEVGISSGKDDRRTYEATAGANGAYTARIVPLPPRTTPTTMPVTINYPSGMIRCTVEDLPISLDDRPLRLWQVGKIERKGDRVTLTGRDGKQISGSRLSVGALKADFGGYMTEIDTFKATSISIGEAAREADRIGYSIVVKREGKTVTEAKGEMQLVGAEQTSIDVAPLPKAKPPIATTIPTTRQNGK